MPPFEEFPVDLGNFGAGAVRGLVVDVPLNSFPNREGFERRVPDSSAVSSSWAKHWLCTVAATMAVQARCFR